VETLQQRVVQLPRNPRALADARVQCHLELMVQLPDTYQVGRPKQRQKERRAEGPEPAPMP